MGLLNLMEKKTKKAPVCEPNTIFLTNKKYKVIAGFTVLTKYAPMN